MAATHHIVTIHNPSGKSYRGKQQICDAVVRTMKAEGVKGQVGIVLVDDAEIKRLHREWFKKNTVTDVITFLIEPEAPILGEIYISIEQAKRQAAEYRVTLTNELSRLAVHGTLHLAGYDDHTENERQCMHNLENRYIRTR
ncbi:MAG: rRNA maturation RNase YbeY [Bradyrhizobiaceae bacterium]|nr:rRNA maturation RNase YbeY [Bradyrhizobiaceae bacterium]